MRLVIILILGVYSTPGTVCWLLGVLCCDLFFNLQQAGQTYFISKCDGPCVAEILPWWFHPSLEGDTSLSHPSPSLASFHLTRLARFLQCPVLGQSSCWLDNFPTSCVCIRASTFSRHTVWLLSVACAVCLLRRRLLFPPPLLHSVPTSTHLGSTLITPLRHFRGISREGYSFALCVNDYHFKLFKAKGRCFIYSRCNTL